MFERSICTRASKLAALRLKVARDNKTWRFWPPLQNLLGIFGSPIDRRRSSLNDRIQSARARVLHLPTNLFLSASQHVFYCLYMIVAHVVYTRAHHERVARGARLREQASACKKVCVARATLIAAALVSSKTKGEKKLARSLARALEGSSRKRAIFLARLTSACALLICAAASKHSSTTITTPTTAAAACQLGGGANELAPQKSAVVSLNRKKKRSCGGDYFSAFFDGAKTRASWTIGASLPPSLLLLLQSLTCRERASRLKTIVARARA